MEAWGSLSTHHTVLHIVCHLLIMFARNECLYTHDSSMCGLISLVIQLINYLYQQQFVVFSHSKQAQGSAVMQQQDINTFKNESTPPLVEKHSCMA